MALSIQCFIRGISKLGLRNNSTITAVNQISQEPIQAFRTNEVNPIHHNESHLNRFYVMSKETRNILFRHGGLPNRFRDQINTFLENAILIRKPAIEIMSYLNATDYSRPVNKYVLYGILGGGKTITVAHILHYGYVSRKILIHIPWVPDWFRRPRESAPSHRKEGYYDLPLDGAAWLAHFKYQNSTLLTDLDLKLSKDYEWNIRDKNLAGTPLLDLITFGIARAKYACDVADALINEIKLASTAGKCNTLVVIDGYNSFWGTESKVKGIDFLPVKPDKVTLTETFTNLTKFDWCNGAIVVTVDEFANFDENKSIYPRYLLGKKGFEHLDPFLPVEVTDYDEYEFEVVMEYYKDRKWVREISEQGQNELELLSNKNPYKVMRYTAPL